MGLLWFSAGFFIGGLIGTILMAAASVASKRDIQEQKSLAGVAEGV